MMSATEIREALKFAAINTAEVDTLAKAARAYADLLENGLQVENGDDPYEVGWCRKHFSVARRWQDESWSCWWESTVESNGHHAAEDFASWFDVVRLGESP